MDGGVKISAMRSKIKRKAILHELGDFRREVKGAAWSYHPTWTDQATDHHDNSKQSPAHGRQFQEH